MLFFIFTIGAFAQVDTLKQTIIGTVIDQQSGNFLGGATVILIAGAGNQISGSTDSAGNFKLKNAPIGRQSIKINHVGYKPALVANIEVTSSKEVVLEIRLTKEGLF